VRRKARGASSSEKILEVVGINFGGVQDLLQGAGLDGVMARNNPRRLLSVIEICLPSRRT
jgi:hypothetical protein